MASYAEIKAKLQQEGKKIRKRASYDEHNLQAAEVRYIRGVYPALKEYSLQFPMVASELLNKPHGSKKKA